MEKFLKQISQELCVELILSLIKEKDMFADMPLGFVSVIITPFVCFILISILYYTIKK